MKTRATYRKQKRVKKYKSRKSLRRYKKRRGGQGAAPIYSIPGTKPIYSKEYIPQDEQEDQDYEPIQRLPTQDDIQQQSQPQYDFATDAGQKITGALNQLKDVFNQTAQQVKDTYKKAKDKTLEQLGKAAEKAQTVAQTANQQIKNIQSSSPILPRQNISGGKHHTRRHRLNNKTKKFPRHKNLQFYV